MKNVLFIFFLSSSLAGLAQALSELEAVTKTDETLAFDYRLHRNPVSIYKYLLTTDSTKDLNLVYRYHGYTIYGNDEGLKKEATGYRLDLQIKPYYIARFGDVDDPFRTQVGIGPKLQWNAKKGFYAVFQWLLPLQNDFTNELGYGARPGELGVGYSGIFGKQHFVNVFTGTLTNRRYGTYGEYNYLTSDSRWYFGGAAYYSGGYIYRENTFTRERIRYFSGYVYTAFRFIRPDITVKVTGERFLEDDYGVTVEVMRQFGNTDIGFYGQKTQNGDNAGILITLALWPRKFYTNRWFQVRPPHSFSLQYDLKAAVRSGNPVRSYQRFYNEILRFNPHFIKNQLKSAGLR